MDIKFKILKLLPSSYRSACESYVSQYQQVASQLRGLIFRSMCPQLIKSSFIICQTVDSSAGWDSKKMRSEPHDWVEKLCLNCREIWNYLQSSSNEFGESAELVREQMWMEICQAAFDTVIEGFSRIRKVSAEGRAAMSMDVAFLQGSLHNIHTCRPPRGRFHLDAFIQASSLGDDDQLFDWIRENWQSYAYRHIHGILIRNMTSMLNSKRLKDAVAVIDSLYEPSLATGGGGGDSSHGDFFDNFNNSNSSSGSGSNSNGSVSSASLSTSSTSSAAAAAAASTSAAISGILGGKRGSIFSRR